MDQHIRNYLEAAIGGVLKILAKFTEKQLCQSFRFNKTGPEFLYLKRYSGTIKKETLALVFSCEFCENFKNTFFKEYFRETSSNYCKTENG